MKPTNPTTNSLNHRSAELCIAWFDALARNDDAGADAIQNELGVVAAQLAAESESTQKQKTNPKLKE